MVEIRASATTDLSPEAVLAAATDFGERRPEIWSNLDPRVYRVEAIGEDSAEAIEGSATFGGIWARERYGWSRPGVVRADVLESNVFGPGSWWELRVTPDGTAGARVEWVSHRVPKGLRGRLLTSMLRLVGTRYVEGYLRETLQGLEARAAAG